jgi:hypothetical protein
MYTNTRILDISISGLLFEISDENLFNYLKKHNTIKMYIPIGKKTLSLSGEIIRFFDTMDDYQKIYRMGVTFISSNPDDMNILENFIYDRRGNILSE